ncbi:DNA polymerase iota [Euwallacea similis]|uniref:DNA polymerase iota n=1 Tax=Euwallacea similis TaxID=1736056 RepID=UPI00345005D2
MNDHSRTIIHLDIDCFYAQVEMVKDPALKHQPLGIQQKSIVVTSNYVAREFGIKKCMPIPEAIKLCPNLVLVKGEDLYEYRKMSQQVFELLSQYSQFVERLGLDENFVDVSELVSKRIGDDGYSNLKGFVYGDGNSFDCDCGCHERLVIGSVIAQQMRDCILENLQLTTCAGIAHNKVLAKIVGSCNKPNKQTVVFPNSAPELMISLGSVGKIPWVGHATEELLSSLNITTVAELQNCSKYQLEKVFGKEKAENILNLSFGTDESPVKLKEKPHSYGLEDAGKPLVTEQQVEEKFKEFSKRLLRLLTEDGRVPKVIKVSLRRHNLALPMGDPKESRQCPFNADLSNEAHIVAVAMSLFWKAVDKRQPFKIAVLGLGFSKLVERPSSKRTLLGFLQRNNADEIKPEKLQESSHRFQSSCQCPPGVDKGVFAELPLEVQQELWDDYKRKEDGFKDAKRARKTGTLLDFVVRSKT